MTDLNALVTVATGLLPSILALVKEAHSTANPDAPPLTDAEVFAALQSAIESSVAKDEQWKAQHPAAPNSTGE